MDREHGNLPWTDIHEFLIDCGSVRNPREFSECIVNKIDRLVPLDQARIYYVDENENLSDEYLLNVDRKWSNLYKERY